MDGERKRFSEIEFALRNASAIQIQSIFRSHRLRYMLGLKPRINPDCQGEDIAAEIKNNLTLSEMLRLFLFMVLNLACFAISLVGTYTVWSGMAEGVNAGVEQSMSSQMILMLFTSIAVVSGMGVFTGTIFLPRPLHVLANSRNQLNRLLLSERSESGRRLSSHTSHTSLTSLTHRGSWYVCMAPVLHIWYVSCNMCRTIVCGCHGHRNNISFQCDAAE